jgi:hypothetical protein
MKKYVKQFLVDRLTEKWIKDNPQKIKLAEKIVKKLMLYGTAKIKFPYNEQKIKINENETRNSK